LAISKNLNKEKKMADSLDHYSAIFWDLENCPPAKGTDSVAIISLIREKLIEYGPIKQIQGYADLSRIPDYLKSSLQSSGVHLIDVPSTRKDAADKMMISDLVMFAVDNPAPQTLILISGDQDFAYPVAKLRLRGYKIIVIVPPGGAAEGLKRQADRVYEWTEFSTLYSSDEIVSEEARESLAYEPLLIAIKYLQDQGHEKPSLAQLGKIIHHLSPQWKQVGVNTLTEYVTKAEEEGLVITGGNTTQPWVALERQTPYSHLNFEDPKEKFIPLLDVLEQAEDENILEPELAWVGSQLRFIFPYWRHKTGYDKLIDYINGAVNMGLISIRSEGLQNYISKSVTGEDQGFKSFSKTLESDIELLHKAWESLREDELLPTERALVGRMREISPGWFLQASSFKTIKGLIKYGEEKKILFVEGEPPLRIIHPLNNPIKGFNPELPITLDFDHGIDDETYSLFLKDLETFTIFSAKGRYNMARILQQRLPSFKKYTLGKLLVLIQVALNRNHLIYLDGEILWEKKEGYLF
jgi:hypothetical protein